MKKSDDNSTIIDQVLNSKHANEQILCFVNILRNSDPILRERGCCFLLNLSRKCRESLENLWSEDMKVTLEALMYDSMEKVRNVIGLCIQL